MSSLKANHLRKTFPGVVALDDVEFEVQSGRVHALVGANGAGKSTLIKILSGFYTDYDGQVELDGQAVRIDRPSVAFDQGIEVVHQEVDVTLIPYLTVAENLLIEKLGTRRAGLVVNWGALYQEARQAAERVGLKADVRKRVEDLSLHEKQLLVISRAVSRRARFLILDEPTASLSLGEVERLFEILKSIKSEGVGVIYISHRLAEVRDIADEVSVLRNGKMVAHFEDANSMNLVVEAMLGHPVNETFPPRGEQERGALVLQAKDLTRKGAVRGVSLQAYQGEILGITGLVGAGKTELLRLLFGVDRLDAGEMILDGRPVRIHSPSAAVAQGIYLIPEERRKQGLIVEDPIFKNITLPFLKLFEAAAWMVHRREIDHTQKIIQQVGLVPPRPEMLVMNLSGGNQQKVVIGKWFGRKPRCMLFDEATQGIDIKAKRDVYDLARQVSKEAGVIYASSEIDEVLGLADRVLVMRGGQVVAELTAQEASRQDVLEYATGIRS
jgi:simple sugar transport system ATP-binding protein